jgi:hypothetical protein
LKIVIAGLICPIFAGLVCPKSAGSLSKMRMLASAGSIMNYPRGKELPLQGCRPIAPLPGTEDVTLEHRVSNYHSESKINL